MKHFLLLILTGFITFGAFSQNNFRTRQDGNWEDANTWEEFNGTAWQNTANVPDETAGTILIESFTSVVINADITIDELTIGEDAFLDIASGVTVTVADGPGTDLVVTIGNGSSIFDGYLTLEAGATLINQGSITSSSANTSFGGTYEHSQDGGALPEAGWSAESVLLVTGTANTVPSNFIGPFYDVVWNNASQATDLVISDYIAVISHDLIIENTNSNSLTLYGGAPAATLAIGNDLHLKPQTSVILSSQGAIDATVGGNFINEGSFTISAAAGAGTIHIDGDVTSTGTLTADAASSFDFSGTEQQVNISASSGDINFTVADNNILHLNESILAGTGSFTSGNNVELYLASIDPNGTLQNGAGGNIQVPAANRTYGGGTTIIYDASVKQFISDGHPSSVPMILSNPQGVELVTDLVLDADLFLTGGSMFLAGHSLTLNQDITWAGGFYVYPTANSTLIFQGNGDLGNFPFPPTPQTIKSLTLDRNGSGGLTLVTDLTVKEMLTLERGTLNVSGQRLEIEGDLSSNSGRLRTDMSTELVISGSGGFAGIPWADPTNQLMSFTLSRSGATIAPDRDLVIFELLDLRNGIFDNSGDRILLLNESEVIRHSNAQLTGAHPGLFSGNYHLTYKGGSMSAGPELPGAGVDELGNLTIEGGPVTITNDLIINGDVALTSGGIFAPGINFAMRGASWDQQLGAFNNDNGRVTFEGTTSVTATDVASFHNIRLSSTADVSFENVRLTGDLDINSAANAVFNDAVQLTGTGDQALNVQGASMNDILLNKSNGAVNITSALNLFGKLSFLLPATINTNDNLTVKADADPLNGGSIQIIPAGSVINGDVTVERYQKDLIPTGKDVFFGSALSDAPVSHLQDDFDVYGSFTGASPGPNTPSLHYYDESQPGDQFTGFTAYPETSNTQVLEPGRGYKALAKGNGDIVIDLSGTLNQGQISIPVTLTDNSMPGADGWNLVANPYAAPIGWDQVGGWDKSSVNNMIVLEVDGRFLYWNGTGAGNSSRTVISNGVIPAGYTFWVQANQDGNLVIEESAKVDPTSLPAIDDPSDQLIISLENGADFDEAVIAVWPDATTGFDAGLDAAKLDNSGFDISTKADDGTPLALNYIAPFGCQEQIDIAISDVANGTYTIGFSEITSLSYPYDITLRDNFLTTDIDVRAQNSYDFTVDENDPATFADRFQLILSIDLAVLVNRTIDLQSDNFVCPDEDATVIMNTSQPGITYQAYLNDVAYGNTFVGTGQTVIIDIPSGDLNADNTFRISATAPACGAEIDLLETLTITRTVVTPQIVTSGDDLVSNYPAGNEWYFDGVLISSADRITPSEEGIYTLTVTLNGCQASAQLDYKIVAGVDEVFSNSISIAPNPASDFIRIYLPQEFAGTGSYEILSTNGALIRNGELTGEMISVSNLANGMYLLRIVTGEKTGLKRLIISQ